MSEANFAEIAARNKLGENENWKAFRWEVIDKDIYKITGGVPTYNNKGKRSWKGSEHKTSYVHQSELEAAKIEYVKTTGNCAECEGKGEIFWGHSSETGTKYKKCLDCNGTGKSLNK